MKALTLSVVTAVALSIGLPAAAQIISTSVPRPPETTSVVPGVPAPPGATAAKRWNIHVMGSPYAKWDMRDFVSFRDIFDVDVLFRTQPQSPLLAGEAVFALGEKGAFGVGGWYNILGKDKMTIDLRYADGTKDELGKEDIELGTLGELHASIFSGKIGLQAGVLLAKQPASTDAGDEKLSRTDFDGYLVYRSSIGRVGSFSLGAGAYMTGKVEDTKSQIRPSGFAAVSVPVYKGLTLDGSFWYIGKTKEAWDLKLDNSMSRITVGAGYTF